MTESRPIHEELAEIADEAAANMPTPTPRTDELEAALAQSESARAEAERELTRLRPRYLRDFEILIGEEGVDAVASFRELVEDIGTDGLCGLSRSHPVGVVRGLAGVLAEHIERLATLQADLLKAQAALREARAYVARHCGEGQLVMLSRIDAVLK